MVYIGIDPGASGGIACYIGIDPGASGGIAWVQGNGGSNAMPMPKTDRDIGHLLRFLRGPCQAQCHAAIEKVHAMPKQGVSSTFKFGVSYGGLCMALALLDIPFERVPPGTWQRALGCLSGGDKNVTKRKAQELFPRVTVTHATADALLIAEWLRRTRNHKEAP